HAAFDDFRGLRHIALKDDVLIPGGEIGRTRCDGRFSHEGRLCQVTLRGLMPVSKNPIRTPTVLPDPRWGLRCERRTPACATLHPTPAPARPRGSTSNSSRSGT